MTIEQLLLGGSLLMLLGIVSSKLSARAGLPVLVAFLGLGMLAGSEGPGGYGFEDLDVAYAVGTVALAFILFNGGLHSPVSTLKLAWKPAALLATVGVFVTSVVTGLAAMWALDLELLDAMLLGAIVGSTDAAAVFSLLGSAGVHLKHRLSGTLEIESGANDPMAIFMTVGLIAVIGGEQELGPGLLVLLVQQLGLGLVVGLAVGFVSVRMINRLQLPAQGLYPVLASACGMLAFGLAALMHGSGFLAIYVAGLVMGNSRLVFSKGTLLFHDGIAWASQIMMFVVLGLLSSPSELIEVAVPGLIVAAVLVFVARPLAVVPLLLPFSFSAREHTLISWVGLKGAVPIILAIYPLRAGIESGQMIFNVVFFVVLVSAIVQGGTLPWVARRLGLEAPAPPEAPLSIEISSLHTVEADIIDYAIAAHSPGAGRLLRDFALPDGAVVAMIARGADLIPPRGSTRVLPDDHLFIVATPDARPAVDAVFSRGRDEGQAVIPREFRVRGNTTAGNLMDMYGVDLGMPRGEQLEQLFTKEAGETLTTGVTVQAGAATLRACDVSEGRLLTVGVLLPHEGAAHAGPASARGGAASS